MKRSRRGCSLDRILEARPSVQWDDLNPCIMEVAVKKVLRRACQ
jgi:hypothetical protein